MNQPYARVNQPYATLTLASALREMFGVQLYKNNARVLLSHILSILNLDWLQHARSVRGVYECSVPVRQLVNIGDREDILVDMEFEKQTNQKVADYLLSVRPHAGFVGGCTLYKHNNTCLPCGYYVFTHKLYPLNTTVHIQGFLGDQYICIEGSFLNK